MKTSWLIGCLVAVIALAGLWYAAARPHDIGTVPSASAGINGSMNQGNMGQMGTGAPQQPLADGAEGAIIGPNLALGIDSTAAVGKHLIAYNGMTVYVYDGDLNSEGATSTCYGTCAQNWPPYLVGAEDNVQQLQAGVNGTAGTINRANGTIQMTYGGSPLYFYAGDKKPGDTTGDRPDGVWHVVGI